MNETESLSIISLIMNAGFTVKVVMLLLFLASVVSWAMIVQRVLYYRRVQAAMEEFERQFWSGGDLGKLYVDGNHRMQTEPIEGIETIFRAGFKEFGRLNQNVSHDPAAIMEGTERAMRVALSREEEKLEKHLAFLASVGSTSPYIGLFGTVWGIMNSFRGLANVHQATLATVAPGISEALIATAMGLFAAIPAVLAYNRFTARMDRFMSHYDTFSDEFSSILHRQVHSTSGR